LHPAHQTGERSCRGTPQGPRLGRYFGTGPALWITLQTQYDLAVAQRDLGARIEREVEEAV
jgi:plasmid maintenance system antidote protein VapI